MHKAKTNKTFPCLVVVFLLGIIISRQVYAAFNSNAFNQTAGSLEITRITPSGEDVPAKQQIIFKFNKPVVAVGRMDRTNEEIPITITPPLHGQWRWLNTSTLALQLGNQDRMRESTLYTIKVKPDFQTIAGIKMQRGLTHSFITQRPQIRYYDFQNWKAPGHPVIRINFNQEVEEASVINRVFFVDKNELVFIPVNSEKIKSHYGTSVIVEPSEELSLNTSYHLKIIPGIVSKEGPELSVENKTIVTFLTFPAFEFLGISGYDNNDKKIVLSSARASDGRESVLFNPLKDISFLFSAPVIPRSEGPKLVVVPDLAGGRTDYNPWANTNTGEYFLRRAHKYEETYRLTLPEILKARQKYNIKSSDDFYDIFGRQLKEPIDIHFTTNHRPPMLSVKNRISVLEHDEQTHLGLYITNLERIEADYRIIDDPSDFWYLSDLRNCGGNFGADKYTTFSVEAVEDKAYAYPFKVREILGAKDGALAGVLQGTPPVKSHCTIKFFSQVSKFAVHIKLGHYNTLAWVTNLNDGQPVADALVELFLYKEDMPITSGITNFNGIAELKGTIAIDPYLKGVRGNFYSGFGVVRVTKGEYSTILPLIREFEEKRAGVYSYNQKKYSHMRSWGTTAQGVYKAGDTIDYKIFIRDQDNRTFILPELAPYYLEVKDPTGKTVYEVKDVILSEYGSFHGSFKVPKGAVSGWYYFYLKGEFADFSLYPLRVLVTDFTPAPFKVQTDIHGQHFHYGDQVKVATSARLHSGGPYGAANARITASLIPSWFQSKDPLLKKFRFMDYNNHFGKQRLFQEEKFLDAVGNLESIFKISDNKIISGSLHVESAVRDDRGKYIASSSTARYSGRDRLVGLYLDQWVLKEDEETQFQVVVVDETGKAVGGTSIEVFIEYDRVIASRVKGAGNAYLTQYKHSTEQVKKFDLRSEETPLTCTFSPQEPGTYHITARINDTEGRKHSSSLRKYAAGKGRIVWEMPDDNSLTIIPAQEEYKVGQNAHFMIKNPYPGCQALVTIERLGVMKQWTEVFAGNSPIIEFEIEPDFVPGFYLSILIHSPRVEKPLGENNPDLGKPSFKLGYLRIPVNDPYKQLKIEAITDKQVYRPGDIVKLTIDISDIHKNHPKTEVAVAVLDEAVLDLIQGGKDHYDPYKGFYKLERLDMRNYNLLMRLTGRQKFEKKGASPGGGGDDGLDFKMRSLFKYVSYWSPSIYPDDQGHASVSFSLPDNLTGWRVLAMAVTPDDLMGLGNNQFSVNKFTEIRPAIPNQVTEGDFFEAVFTVMNRTDKERTLTVNILAEGQGVEAEPIEQKVTARPYVRNKVPISIAAAKQGKITFKVSAGDEFDQDGLLLTMPIRQKRAVEAAATYGTTTAAKVSEDVKFPRNIVTNTGKVSVVVSPSIISSLEGAFEYMKTYPYYCWEQRLSVGVLALNYLNLKHYIAESFTWDKAKDMVLSILEDAGSFQAPNGGMCYFIPADGYVSPYLSAYTAMAFNWIKESKYKPDGEVESKLHDYLLNLLRKDAFPSFFSRGMYSTVRAVALAALAQNGKVGEDDLRRYLSHVQYMDLFGKAHFLLAAAYIDNTQEIQKKIYHMIMSHANESGGKVIFTDSVYGENIKDSGFDRILSSEIRTNAAVLSALLAMEEYTMRLSANTQTKQISKQQKDQAKGNSFLPTDTAFKIVRYITQTRHNSDHWENTQENAFCMQALANFSRVYDRDLPKYTITASMDEKVFGEAFFDNLTNEPKEFSRQIEKNDPGRLSKLQLTKKGPGRLYYTARLFYSPKDLKTEPINSGIEVHREYYVEREDEWIALNQPPMKIKQGELVRVVIFLSIPTAKNFVVVDDPVPGGLEPVNRNLATASTVDADKDNGIYSGASWWHKHENWRSFGYSRWSFYHKELLHHSVRFYSEYLPAGNYHLSYIAQAIAPGKFSVMPLHAEEMYDPDVFGQGMPSFLEVEAK